MKKIILTLLTVCLPVVATSAQEAGQISGTIVDAENGETIIGASIGIIGTTNGAASDIDGNYTIRNLQPGTYDLRVSYISYQTQNITGVEVVAGETTILDIAMQTEVANPVFYTHLDVYKRQVLDGAVFVTNGADLFIEAGTVIKAEDGQDVDATALVITRGSKIFAEGTSSNPIIFTSVNDDGTLDKDDTGEWGGVVILGKASTNNASEKLIEGLDQIETDPALVGYGGTDDMDNSGVLRYVSIRHTGINVGQDSGNEIQGLTLGGVGAGTTIEYVESFASADDGYEFFGGTDVYKRQI